jgi:hypothetical protein
MKNKPFKEDLIMANNQPVHKISPDTTWATIWEHIHVGQDRCFDVTVRVYNGDGPWKKTSSLGPDDVLVLAEVLDQAHKWIAAQKEQQAESEQPAARLLTAGLFQEGKTI